MPEVGSNVLEIDVSEVELRRVRGRRALKCWKMNSDVSEAKLNPDVTEVGSNVSEVALCVRKCPSRPPYNRALIIMLECIAGWGMVIFLCVLFHILFVI